MVRQRREAAEWQWRQLMIGGKHFPSGGAEHVFCVPLSRLSHQQPHDNNGYELSFCTMATYPFRDGPQDSATEEEVVATEVAAVSAAGVPHEAVDSVTEAAAAGTEAVVAGSAADVVDSATGVDSEEAEEEVTEADVVVQEEDSATGVAGAADSGVVAPADVAEDSVAGDEAAAARG